MQTSTSDHWQALKRVLRYLADTLDHGVHISKSAPLAFSDADWVGDKNDFLSTTGYLI